MKLRWWLERGQDCLSSLWKAGGSFAVRSAQRYLFWKHVAVLHYPASPPWSSCQKPLVTFGSTALMSQAICSWSFGQTPISHPELTHLPEHPSCSSTALLLSSLSIALFSPALNGCLCFLPSCSSTLIPSEVCSSACFIYTLSSDSFAPDFYFSSTSHTLEMKSTVDL